MRVELNALLIAVTPKPAILITGDASPTPAIDVARVAFSLLSGQGEFACCACKHLRISDAGVSLPIPCEKQMAGQVLLDLLEQRIDHHRHRGEWDEMRLFKALSSRFLWGLGVETQAGPATSEAFLGEFEFIIPDEPGSSPAAEHQQSKHGVSPLFLAVLSGNLEMTRTLARTNPADVTARLKLDFPMLCLWAGGEPIHAAAALCITNNVPVIATLLEGGADPNAAAGKVGITPLYAAVVTHNLEGIQALIASAGDRLEMEKKNRLVSDTALGGAAYLATPAVVDALLATANIKVAHINAFGSTKLTGACGNSFATPDMLASLCRDGTIDVCCCRKLRTYFWAVVCRLFEMAVWLRLLSPDFAMGMAHSRGSTALQTAAQHGHTSLVRWLLDNGARKSLHIKNAMGCTPLDVAHMFGPFPETTALLVQATLSVKFEERYAIRCEGRLSSRQRLGRAVASWSTSSRSIPRALSLSLSSVWR